MFSIGIQYAHSVHYKTPQVYTSGSQHFYCGGLIYISYKYINDNNVTLNKQSIIRN